LIIALYLFLLPLLLRLVWKHRCFVGRKERKEGRNEGEGEKGGGGGVNTRKRQRRPLYSKGKRPEGNRAKEMLNGRCRGKEDLEDVKSQYLGKGNHRTWAYLICTPRTKEWIT